MQNKVTKYSIIGIFILLYLIVSTISMIHSIDFFSLSNSQKMALALAAAFEVGQVAALCGILILDKTSKTIVWSLFILLTSMQIMSNVYFSYKHMGDFRTWSELFGLSEEDTDVQKRALSIISGGILPVVALGFIKSLVDYIKPGSEIEHEQPVENQKNSEKVITITEEVERGPEREINEDLNLAHELQPVEQTVVQPDVELTEHNKVENHSDHYSLWKKNI